MKFIRKKFVLRVFSVLSILFTLNSVIAPTVSYALTTGPHQPEFTSYEEPSATDMVNLLTGDFNFNIPVLSVPNGSDAGFTVPLIYHAGISPDQEASWVGLGWNINVGSITRGINGFPDDANNDQQSVTVQDLSGVRGWSSSIFGIINSGWNTQSGNYGSINLFNIVQVGFSKGLNADIAGLQISGDGVRFNAEQFAIAVVSAVMLIASMGTAAPEIDAMDSALGTAMDVVNVGSMIANQVINGSPTPNAPSLGYWEYTKKTQNHIFYSDYWISLDQTRIEDMYGALYLDKVPLGANQDETNFLNLKNSVNGTQQPLNQFLLSGSVYNRGAASDINIDLTTAPNYIDNTSPALLAYDNFTVNGPGISGAIKPYRMEVGSVGVPREMSPNHVRLAPVPYMDYGTNKVPFVYAGAMGNRYFYHGGDPVAVNYPSFNFGVNSAFETGTGTTGPNLNSLRYGLNDVVFGSQRLSSDVTSRSKLAQGHYIDWLTNSEANVSGAYTNTAYMDYFKGPARSVFRTNYDFGGRQSYFSTGNTFDGIYINFSGTNYGTNFANGQFVDINVNVFGATPHTDSYKNVQISIATATSLTLSSTLSNTYMGQSVTVEVISHTASKSSSAIGAFVITDPSGMNYHYSLPSYDYSFYSENINATDNTKRSTISRNAAFANTWLLTAITGPDFIDRGTSGNAPDGYIDDNDWGYWIKFNYGKNGVDFNWALPYNKNKPTSDNAYYSYASGQKEKYFLNSIETRSHVALFVKSTRLDGKDANTITPKSTLRLSEINLITKDTYRKLISSKYSMNDASGSIGFCYTDDMFTGSTLNTYRGNFMRASALKRLLFNQDYSLCPGVPTSTQGKLTLKSLSVCGKYDSTTTNISKIFPDYKFEYNNNPAYDANKWDGWGMYSSAATSSGTTHQATINDADGSAWSLTKITNPEGSEIVPTYERDTYTSISGTPFPSTDGVAMSGTASCSSGASSIYSFVASDVSKLKVGDPLSLSGTLSYVCPSGSAQNANLAETNPFTYLGTISSIVGNTVTMTGSFASPTMCGVYYGTTPVTISGTAMPQLKRGGNIRVATLTLNDPAGQSYKTQYQYANGTVSEEPDYIRTSILPFYNYLNYPSTPVMYGQVTLLTGKLSTLSDYHTSQVYQFITPNISQYSISTTKVKDKALLSDYLFNSTLHFRDYSSLIQHQISNHTNQIGNLLSIKTYDKSGVLTVEKDCYYTEALTTNNANNYEGIFSEGTLLVEAVVNQGTNDRYHRGQRTTQFSYPYTLQKVVTTQDGFVSQTENRNWDSQTGGVIETRETSPAGMVTQKIIEPAYLDPAYPDFDSKAKNVANKNMLTQEKATYVYRLDALGNQTGLISATANVWKKNWTNYRILDINNNYTNDPDLTYPQIWRLNGTYAWKGIYGRLQADGTQNFLTSDKFNFGSPGSNTNWQLVNSKERYNHYSSLLEAKDINSIYAVSKLGYSDQFTIASASNAQYEEVAYSGAEDLIQSSLTSPYFGGEVSRGPSPATVVTSPVHTGTNALSVSTGYGFIYKSSNLIPNKTYRASVWTNSTNGRIYYKLNNGAEMLSQAPTTQTQVGSWYRLDLLINTGATSVIEVGVKSATGAVVIFDDFRFQPMQAAMTAYVYNPVTHVVEYILGNDNLYTRYYYDNRGVLMKTYVESIKYNGERLVSERKDDYKRNHSNQ